MVLGCSMLATIRSVPPRWPHVLTSMLKTRLRRRANGHRAALFVAAAAIAVGRTRLLVRRATFAAAGCCELRAQIGVRRRQALEPGEVGRARQLGLEAIRGKTPHGAQASTAGCRARNSRASG